MLLNSYQECNRLVSCLHSYAGVVDQAAEFPKNDHISPTYALSCMKDDKSIDMFQSATAEVSCKAL